MQDIPELLHNLNQALKEQLTGMITGYYLPKRKRKSYNVMIDRKNVFDQSVKNDIRAHDNIWQISTGQGDDYTTGFLLDYNYFKEHYNIIAIDLSKQKELDFNPKAIQQISFTGNLENQSATFFNIEEVKELVLDFSQRTVKVF